ncbi:MAG: hypothetical protein ACLQVI_42605 [Polyangiaceae bacterium]
MKRLFSVALFGAAVAVLGGCPVWSDNPNAYRVCDGNTCWSCPADYVSDQCSPWGCNGNMDCPGGYECGENNTCVSMGGPEYDAGVYTPVDATAPPTSCSQPGNCPSGYSCGAGGVCELGDCSVTGCVAGYVCELENGTLQCVLESTPPPPVDSGTPDSGVACQSNADCASTPGALCLDGTCVPPANQCYDGTQCPTGDQCVNGACTPSCGGNTPCPTGYSCADIEDSSTSGVCTGNPTPCETNPTVCPTGTVCSQDHCVAPCSDGTCPTGDVCIQGGCVPNQEPNFFCTTDGVQDACASGSICLHHSCYIACNPDAGASACQSAAQFNECKPVAASGSTYYVCGSATNLGTQCNPTTGQECSNSAAVCIDGFCY